MAEEIHHPHDLMVHAVLSDVTEASSFLQAHLPGEMSQELNWSTLRLVEGSFVDEDLRGSEADLLYEVERVLSQDAVWLYILLSLPLWPPVARHAGPLATAPCRSH